MGLVRLVPLSLVFGAIACGHVEPAAPVTPAPAPRELTIHMDEHALEDAAKRVGEGMSAAPPTPTASFSSKLRNATVRVWPSSGPMVELHGALVKVRYTSVSRVLDVEVWSVLDAGGASQVSRFVEPARWDEIPAKGEVIADTP